MLDLEWVTIPRGKFIYGVQPGQEPEYHHQPAETVHLETFQISRYPVTWRQFAEWAASDHRWAIRNIYPKTGADAALSDYRKRAAQMPDHPATMPWAMAWAFCEWIGARLPTSREWEKAARGPDGRTYPWGDQWDETRGFFYDHGAPGAQRRRNYTSVPVNAFPGGASPYGVLDLMGNMLEYTMSTTLGIDEANDRTEKAICRGSMPSAADAPRDSLPADHRVTRMFAQSMSFGGYEHVGLRPVRGTWQMAALNTFG